MQTRIPQPYATPPKNAANIFSGVLNRRTRYEMNVGRKGVSLLKGFPNKIDNQKLLAAVDPGDLFPKQRVLREVISQAHQ